MPTIDDVAKLAGVSTATVSRVVNRSGKVAARTEARVLEVMERLEYYPNKFAQGLAGNRSDGIGIVTQDFTDPYFGMMLRSIEQVTKAQNLQITVASGNRIATDELKAIAFLRQQQYNVVILNNTVLSERDLQDLLAQGTEFVHVGPCPAVFAERTIHVDDMTGTSLAIGHLLTQGHRRIAHLALPTRSGEANARREGYRRALEDARLPYLEELVVECDSFYAQSGYRATERLLRQQLPFTAIFAATDLLASGAFLALRQEGLRVPEDVSLVGYDDIDAASFFQPPLTTVKQPIPEIATAAAQLAIGYLNETREEVKRWFVPNLVVRDSVQPR